MMSRQTIKVDDDVGPNKEVSIKVEATNAIVVERPIYFNYNNMKPGGHSTVGAKTTSTNWYFAEGCTSDNFFTWLTLQNPQTTAADVAITYMFSGGAASWTKNITIPAQSRKTIDVNEDVGSDKEVSIKIESTEAIVAERPMYFNYGNKWRGGHNTIGTTTVGTVWYFAEGYTGENFDTWLVMQNPDVIDADVTVTYYDPDGGTTTRNKTVAANSRETVSVDEDVGEGQEVSIQVVSDRPLAVERPMYFNYRNQYQGGHNTMGVKGRDGLLFFAEGSVQEGFDTWLVLQNPAAIDVTALVYYQSRTSATSLLKVKAVPAYSRVTIDVNNDVGVAMGDDIAIKIWSTQPIVAERSMYFNYQNKWAGGHNTVAFRNSGGATIP